jgi:hypothetical protein
MGQQNQRVNRCVGCETAADCTDATRPICATETYTCVACQTNEDCTDTALPTCGAAGVCVADN